MPTLRKVTAVAAVAVTIAASFPASPVLAQTAVIPTSTTSTAPVDEIALIQSTVNAFPNGGEPLKLAISDLVAQHPDLASAVATYLRTNQSLSAAQKEAIVAGLSDALNRLGIVAQAGGNVNPVLIALLAGGAGLVGVGIWAATKHSSGSSGPVSSN